MTIPSTYAKAIAAVAGTVSIVIADGIIDTPDIVTIALSALTALGVYTVPNTPTPKD